MKNTSNGATNPKGYPIVVALTYSMFFMFAMTTDAVGEIIRIVKAEMSLTNTEASLFHWATMIGIALSGMLLGFLADRIGRKKTIILGLSLYGAASALFAGWASFSWYLSLLFVSGLAIGVFKTAILALIGDIATSTSDHTRRMNANEGFFALGAIVGPLLVTTLDKQGLSWVWLYLIAASMCAVMIIAAALTSYPESIVEAKAVSVDKRSTDQRSGLLTSISLIGNPYALGFSIAIALYVACEVSIFVWAPTLFADYVGTKSAMWIATYAVTIFFVLRAVGRFAAVWLLGFVDWKIVMVLFTGAICACFVASSLFGKDAAVFSLPLSGLFMSMIYPTLNSKGISCLPKSRHGAVAGLILFFTAVSAAFAPLAMGYVADVIGGGNMQAGFYLATVFSIFLLLFSITNLVLDPAGRVLMSADQSEY